MKFKYFHMMDEFFVDTWTWREMKSFQLEREEDHSKTTEKKSHQQLMREIAKSYYKESLEMQHEALEFEKQKVN